MGEENKPKTIDDCFTEMFDIAIRGVREYYSSLDNLGKTHFIKYLSEIQRIDFERSSQPSNPQILRLFELGRYVYEKRSCLSLTQEQLSEQLDKLPNKARKYHRTFIAKLETGKIKRTTYPNSANIESMRRDFDAVFEHQTKNRQYFESK